MARSPIYSTLTKVQGMITYVRENLSTEEYDLFLDMLVPEPEPEVKTVKRGRKKGGKSKRAAALSEQISDASGIRGFCTAKLKSTGKDCGLSEFDSLHDASFGYVDFHPFVSSNPAHRARKKSSPKGVEANSTASTATETEGVSTAVGAGG